MADWYVSSVAWSAIPAWAASTAYTVGQIVRPTAPGLLTQYYTFRCTTAGTSGTTEPTWSGASTNNNTIASGTATFTNVTGQSAYGWAACAGTLITIETGNRGLVGDRIFLSSDHIETTVTTAYEFNNNTASFKSIQIISVNRAGSVPPVPADAQSGASIGITSSSNLVLNAYCNMYWQGVTISIGGSSNVNLNFNNSAAANKTHYLKNCAIVISNTNSGVRIIAGAGNGAKITLDNTTIQFGSTAQAITCPSSPFDFNWINTPSAILGTSPTTLFTCAANVHPFLVTCRGVDLSAITGTLCSGATSTNCSGMKALFDSCRIASSVTRLATPTTTTNSGDEVELVNCYDGTNIINERYQHSGSLVTDRNTYLSGGAQDDVGVYSLKLASNSRADKLVLPFDCFIFDVENVFTGASKTATIEIISAASLNNDDISLLLEYMSASGNPVASFVNSLPVVLAAGTALPSSSTSWTAPTQYATWNPADVTAAALSNNNLTVTTAASPASIVRATRALGALKYYFEITQTTTPNAAGGYGLAALTTSASAPSGAGPRVAFSPTFGWFYVNGSSGGSPSIGGRAANDIVGLAFDMTPGSEKIWCRVCPAGNWNGSSSNDPATGVGGYSIAAAVAQGAVYPYCGDNSAVDTYVANFGASAFSGAMPSGYVSLPTTPTVKQLLQTTFTPQRVGRVRGLVRLGKSATFVWVNPQIAIS